MSQLHIALKSVTTKYAFLYLTIISTKKSAHEIHIWTNIHTSFIEKDSIYLKLLEGKKCCLFQAMEHKSEQIHQEEINQNPPKIKK